MEMPLYLLADWNTIIKTIIIIKYQIKLFINKKQVSHNSLYFKKKKSLRNEYNERKWITTHTIPKVKWVRPEGNFTWSNGWLNAYN